MADWTQDAACRDYDGFADDFFQPRGVGNKRLRELCRGCPVNVACLDWAIRHERWGWWAMTNEEERDAYRKRLGISVDEPNAWLDRRPPEFKPCGTRAAAKAHQRRGEPLCETCVAAETERRRRYKKRMAS